MCRVSHIIIITIISMVMSKSTEYTHALIYICLYTHSFILFRAVLRLPSPTSSRILLSHALCWSWTLCACALTSTFASTMFFFPLIAISLSLSLSFTYTYSSNCQISDRVNTHPGNMFEDVWPAGFRIYCLYTSVSSLTHAYIYYIL